MSKSCLTPEQAAAKAFRNCRRNHEKSELAARYLARQYLVASGVSAADAATHGAKIQGLLAEWFRQRRNNPSFTPDPNAASPPTAAPAK